MADQAYFQGDFWQCIEATEAGESPATNPEKWSKIRLLSKWRFVLARLTHANLLTLDDQHDKAQAERETAYHTRDVGLEDLVRAEALAEESSLDERRGNHFAHGPTAAYCGDVKASVILDDAYRLIGWDSSQLDDRHKADARMCLSQALQKVWEKWWWRQLMQCSKLQLASTLDETATYTAGQTAYDPGSDTYVTALETCLGSDSESFEVYDPNRQGDLNNWDEAQAYTAGDQFQWAGSDYQCLDDAPAATLPTDTDYFAPMQNWHPRVPWRSYGGILQEPFGAVRSVSQFDPRIYSNPTPFRLDVGQDGTRIRDLTVTHPWVWARRVVPILDADDFDSAATYEAVNGANLVFGTDDDSYLVVEGGYLQVQI